VLDLVWVLADCCVADVTNRPTSTVRADHESCGAHHRPIARWLVDGLM